MADGDPGFILQKHWPASYQLYFTDIKGYGQDSRGNFIGFVGLTDRCSQHLMALGGYLSADAYHNNKQLEVWVMKEYDMKESWVKEFNTGTYLPQTVQQEGFRCLNSRVGFPNSFV
ncbi:hypothetical protein CRYUN_Cryun14cG0144500 [Craigia yunnanensis]